MIAKILLHRLKKIVLLFLKEGEGGNRETARSWKRFLWCMARGTVCLIAAVLFKVRAKFGSGAREGGGAGDRGNLHASGTRETLVNFELGAILHRRFKVVPRFFRAGDAGCAGTAQTLGGKKRKGRKKSFEFNGRHQKRTTNVDIQPANKF